MINEIQVKRAIKAGNSSAVILPRAWLNREVRIELIKKTPETILLEVIGILKEHIELKKVVGIYLVGSYARNEEDANSDIDILVVSDNIDRESIRDGIYNILIVSKELIKQKMETDLFPIGQMIKEALPLMNADYLKKLEVKITKKNIKWYLDTTKEKIKLIDKNLKKEKINNRVIYTLILRIRTLYIIGKLIENKSYSKKEFVKMITKISGNKTAYVSYVLVKDNREEAGETKKEEAERLLNYLRKQLEDVKKRI